MNIYLLGAASVIVEPYITATNDTCIQTDNPITAEMLITNKTDIIVSYGYRHILREELLSICPAVNLHISYLPWNRGADPNLWSFLEMTPRGVTVHYMDRGVDTGNIIAQRLAEPAEETSTLRTTYAALSRQIVALFGEYWPVIRTGRCPSIPQKGRGTYHRSTDKERYRHLLSLGWDTPVAELRGRACRVCEKQESGAGKE